ncbi:MAG: redoxin domain-containing protein [Rhodothermales bacterium]
MNRYRAFACTLLWTLLLVYSAQSVNAQELALGSTIPGSDVVLNDVTGGTAWISDLTGEAATVVVFWSNQCPWIDKYTGRFNAIVSDFSERGVKFVLVNSNDGAAFPQESLEQSAAAARSFGQGVSYVSDQSSGLAKAFGAERTPHVFVFDGAGELAYVGTIDDSPGDPGNVTAEYLRQALEGVTSGGSVAVPKTKAFGCTIKFKS